MEEKGASVPATKFGGASPQLATNNKCGDKKGCGNKSRDPLRPGHTNESEGKMMGGTRGKGPPPPLSAANPDGRTSILLHVKHYDTFETVTRRQVSDVKSETLIRKAHHPPRPLTDLRSR